jgi:hypothetical protein
MPLPLCREGGCGLLFLSYRSKAAARPSLHFSLFFWLPGIVGFGVMKTHDALQPKNGGAQTEKNV